MGQYCSYCTTKGGNRREVSFALRDIEVNRDLIVVAGVGGVVFDVFLGDHVHLQEGAEEELRAKIQHFYKDRSRSFSIIYCPVMIIKRYVKIIGKCFQVKSFQVCDKDSCPI